MNICIRTLTASLALLGLSGAAVFAQQSTDTTAAPKQTEATAQTPAVSNERYGSYEAKKDGFAGAIAEDYTAEELIGKDVVGPDDTTVATVADLLIGSDDRIEKVVLDVGGFLGIGSKPVAVDIVALERPSAEDEPFRTAMTRDQLDALPQYERSDDVWSIM